MIKNVDNNVLNLYVGLQAWIFSKKFADQYLVGLVLLRNRQDNQQVYVKIHG